MPKWIHDRAEHIRRKNPGMDKSQAFAIATQQSHATGHTPKGYGTAEGKSEAKAKYDEPKSAYEQKADPSHKEKSAAADLVFWKGFSDELTKIATMPGAKLPRLPKPTTAIREPAQAVPMRDPLSSMKNTSPPPVTAGA